VPNLTTAQALKIRDFVGFNLAHKYSVAKAGLAGISYGARNNRIVRGVLCVRAAICSDKALPAPASTDKFFCSELVFAAFESAGVPLLKIPPSHVAPADIPDLWIHKKLLYVGHLKSNGHA
jgi:hypothetical protein